MKKRKNFIFGGIALVALVGGFFGYRVYAGNQAESGTELQTAAVEIGSLAQTLSSSGNTRAGQTATIKWETSGKVGEVILEPGDAVEEDQALAELDPNTLSNEMIEYKQKLIQAQQALEDLRNSKLQQAQALQALEETQENLNTLRQTTAEGTSQAQLALAEAQEVYEKAVKTRAKMNYPHTSDELVVEQAETKYLLAKQTYKDALAAFQAVDHKKLTNPERVQALNRLVSAEAAMDAAFATYNWYLLGYTDVEIARADADVAVALANLEVAQAKWNSMKDGTSEAAVALAEAQQGDAQREYERVKDGPNAEDLAAAQAAVDAAQAALDNAQLLAPFSGTITEVNISTGDLVNNGDAAFRLDDLSAIYVDLQISEVDLASLKVGQPVTFEFDAIADKIYNGEVTEIGMIGSVAQGVVNYPATVRVADADKNIRPGMTASVTITVDQAENALLVPNRAIRTSGGLQSVTVLFEGEQIEVPVTVGLVGDVQSEIISDQLRPGDVVVVNGTTATANGSPGQGNNMMGGGQVFMREGGPGMLP